MNFSKNKLYQYKGAGGLPGGGNPSDYLRKNASNIPEWQADLPPADFKQFYVNSYNTQDGDGSFSNPFKTLDLAQNFIVTNDIENVTINVAGGVYTTTSNKYISNVNWNFAEGVIVNYTGDLSSYLFDMGTNPCKIFGKAIFNITNGGFLISGGFSTYVEFYGINWTGSIPNVNLIALSDYRNHTLVGSILGINRSYLNNAIVNNNKQLLYTANDCNFTCSKISFSSSVNHANDLVKLEGSGFTSSGCSFGTRFENCIFSLGQGIQCASFINVIGLIATLYLKNCEFVNSTLSNLSQGAIVLNEPRLTIDSIFKFVDTYFSLYQNTLTYALRVNTTADITNIPGRLTQLPSTFINVNSIKDVIISAGYTIANDYIGASGFTVSPNMK